MDKLADLLCNISIEQSKKVSYKEEKKTYFEIKQDSLSIKERILEFGKNKLIGIFLPNSIAFIETFFAIQFAERIPVLLPTIERNEALCRMIIDTNIDLIITDTEHKKILVEELEHFEHSVNIYNVDTDKVSVKRGEKKADNLLNSELNDVAVVIKTSGTIEQPKYIMLTHKGVLGNIKAHINSVNYSKDENTLIFLPMCFGYCLSSQMLAHIYMNASIHISNTPFDCMRFVNDVYINKITNTTTVSAVISLLARYIRIGAIDIEKLSQLKLLIFGGMPIAMEDIETVRNALPNTKLIQTYGQTEHSPRTVSYTHLTLPTMAVV